MSNRLITCAGVLAVGIATTALPRAVGQSAPSRMPRTVQAPPVQLTNDQERQRTMDLLGIKSLPPGANGSSPDTNNEAKANPIRPCRIR